MRLSASRGESNTFSSTPHVNPRALVGWELLPHLSAASWILLPLAAIGAGAANALAGGGMFLAFPALLFAGISPITANATATFALIPGGWTSAWVYRDSLKHGWRLQGVMALVSAGGAWLGSELLLHTPEQGFARLVPYLMLGATMILTFAGMLRRAAAAHAARTTHYVPLIGGQFLVAVYAGYFGAGIGVLSLALYLATAHMDMHQASGLRLLCGGAANTVAAMVFSVRGIIQWGVGIPMIFASILGGYFGARLMKRMDPDKTRRVILAYAWAITIFLFVRGA